MARHGHDFVVRVMALALAVMPACVDESELDEEDLDEDLDEDADEDLDLSQEGRGFDVPCIYLPTPPNPTSEVVPGTFNGHFSDSGAGVGSCGLYSWLIKATSHRVHTVEFGFDTPITSPPPDGFIARVWGWTCRGVPVECGTPTLHNAQVEMHEHIFMGVIIRTYSVVAYLPANNNYTNIVIAGRDANDVFYVTADE